MTETDLQTLLAAISAALGATTLGFLLNVVKVIRDNAQDRIAIQEERLKIAAQEQVKTEKWAGREKDELKKQLEKLKGEMESLLAREGLDLNSLALGRQLSESAVEVRSTAQALVSEMKLKLNELSSMRRTIIGASDSSAELILAMGSMASGSYGDAAGYFDSYTRDQGQSWLAHYSRGVAHANARGGVTSDISALRAYNDAIALAPEDIESNAKARLFIYRGAMLKRLGRLAEAKSDIQIGLDLAEGTRERLDAHYNFACIYSMLGEQELMYAELTFVISSSTYIRAITAHTSDYFKNFSKDQRFKELLESC